MEQLPVDEHAITLDLPAGAGFLCAPCSAAADGWGLGRRLLFRVVFAYLVLYNLPFPLYELPGTDRLTGAYEKLWQGLVPWVGRHLLRLPTDITVAPNGGGDTTYHYVQLLCFFVLATAAAVLWGLLDARRTQYPRLHDWLRLYVRYALAATLVTYGMAKVIKLQFPFPGPDRLMETYGESSPMGLLWTFMGYSTGYTFFAGAAEVLGGVLLLFRRTTMLGAVLVAAVMTNVVMLNFCYDVPVKQFSSHLLFMALFLLLPDLRRLVDLFLRDRPVLAAVPRVPFSGRWMERAALCLKVLFGAWLLWSHAIEARASYGEQAPEAALAGLYDVEQFTQSGELRPPLTTDTTRWRMVAINRRWGLSIKWMDDSMDRLRMKDDPAKGTLTLRAWPDNGEQIVLRYFRTDPERLILEGTFRGAALKVQLRKVDDHKFRLVNRGFHFISESPYSR